MCIFALAFCFFQTKPGREGGITWMAEVSGSARLLQFWHPIHWEPAWISDPSAACPACWNVKSLIALWTLCFLEKKPIIFPLTLYLYFPGWGSYLLDGLSRSAWAAISCPSYFCVSFCTDTVALSVSLKWSRRATGNGTDLCVIHKTLQENSGCSGCAHFWALKCACVN